MPAVQEALRPLEGKEGVLKTELRINERTRELFISDEMGERYIVRVRGEIQWATLSTLVKHGFGSDTLGATNREIEEAVRLAKADSDACQPAGNYVFNLRTLVERNPREPKIITQTGTTRNHRYRFEADVILTEETRLSPKVQERNGRGSNNPAARQRQDQIFLRKPWEEKPVQVQKKPKEEAKRIVMVGDRVARVLGEILLFRPNWQHLRQALARHGVEINERNYSDLQRYDSKTMKSDGADNQALSFLTDRIIPNFASAHGQSDYARFLFNILEPLPQEELLKVFGEMRFQFVTKAHLL